VKLVRVGLLVDVLVDVQVANMATMATMARLMSVVYQEMLKAAAMLKAAVMVKAVAVWAMEMIAGQMAPGAVKPLPLIKKLQFVRHRPPSGQEL